MYVYVDMEYIILFELLTFVHMDSDGKRCRLFASSSPNNKAKEKTASTGLIQKIYVQ